MNMGRLVSMIVNQIMRRLVNAGINKGMGHLAKGKGGKTGAGKAGTTGPSQSGSARETAKRERQAARITRRLGK